MSDIKYQKIELHSTYDLEKDYEIIEQERIAAQKLLEDNQIQFDVEIDQKEIKSPTGRNTHVVYVLNLIVREDDVEKVIELLDKDGNFGYYVDLEDTYNPDEESEENESQNEENIISNTEFKKEDIDGNPIKSYSGDDIEEDLESYKIKFEPKLKSIEYRTFPRFIMKLFLSLAYMIILIPEMLGFIYGIKELEYELATTMFVFIVIETPIFIHFYNVLNKKNK